MRKGGELRRRVYDLLEDDQRVSPLATLVARGIILLIVIDMTAMVLASVPELEGRYGPVFDAVEIISLVAFTIEYALRLWVAPEHLPHRHLGARSARLKYVVSGMGLIDLAAVLPFWIAPLYGNDLRALLLFGIVRFFKLARYSTAMRSLLTVLYSERRLLTGTFVILVGATLAFACAMYLIERSVQPDKFGTIPDAIWWAIVTLCTVGYGDVVPATAAGKVVAGFAIITGLMMIALPVAVIARAFAEEVHRREFVVTWSMVARVPLFANLEASDIADIMRLLRARTVEAGGTVVRRGEPATSMYFITAGEVEVDLPNERVRLGINQFFGEVALLRRSNRSATVVAITRANLLVLDAHDFHALMERSPQISGHISEVVKSRVGSERVTPRGDIASEELEAGSPEPDDGKT